MKWLLTPKARLLMLVLWAAMNTAFGQTDDGHCHTDPPETGDKRTCFEFSGLTSQMIQTIGWHFTDVGYLVDSSSPHMLWYGLWRITQGPWLKWRPDLEARRRVGSTC